MLMMRMASLQAGLLLMVMSLFIALPAHAVERLAPELVCDYLARPGCAHTVAPRLRTRTGDSKHLDIQDGFTQCNFNDQGRSQAMSLGKELHSF